MIDQIVDAMFFLGLGVLVSVGFTYVLISVLLGRVGEKE